MPSPLTKTLWYPMRVTYNRELHVKESLDNLGIENFVPMRSEVVKSGDKTMKMRVPAIHNLIFVHTSRERLNDLKSHHAAFAPMRYIMKRKKQELSTEERILVVPDVQMENFIRVASVDDDSVIFLDYNEQFLGKEGCRVRITGGKFGGVEGTIRRIHHNKHVVVQIEGLAAVAIVFVPACMLEEI